MSEFSALAVSEGYEVRDDDGFGEAPQQAFSAGLRPVENCKCYTLALLAVSCELNLSTKIPRAAVVLKLQQTEKPFLT